ncbi:MAG TPA: ABC transporter permease [Terriglobia bacterium]|nr:ABC transporter permease [Terriglobia bacterium]
MSMFSSIRTFLDFVFTRRRVEREMEEELRSHLQIRADDLERRGLSRAEAERQARVEFGGYQRYKEECREVLGTRLAGELLADLRYGLRQFRRNPGFTAVAILTLALGIGANTAIFSVIDAVMLRMLPVQSPEQLVQIGFQGKHSGESFVGESFSYQMFRNLRRYNQVFTDISAFDHWDLLQAYTAESHSSGESVTGQLVSVNFFSLLGLNPVIGRMFALDEDSGTGGHPVAVISYALWTRMFARDPSVLGKSLSIGSEPFTIIGVAPSRFGGVSPGRVDDFWVPVSMQPQVLPGGDRLTESDTNWLSLIARLKPGVSAKQARGELDIVYQQIQHEHDFSHWSSQQRRDFFTHHIVLLPAATGTDYLRREFSRPLFLLMAMVAMVLLIACANVATLLLARGSARLREIAVRLALGAARARLIRQLLTESVLLAVLGGALGVLFAYWASPVLVALMAHGQSGLRLNVHPDLVVLGFALLVALTTGIAFGLTPALRATRPSANESAQAASRNLATSRRGRKLGSALVIVQITISLVLIASAGLLVRTLHNLETMNPGFSRAHVLLFEFNPSKAGYKGERAAQLRREVLDRILHAPGVRSASFSFLTPISGGGWDNDARSVEDYTPHPGENMDIFLNAVGPGFFRTLGTPLLFGRDFGSQDRSGSPLVALINETMVRRFFGQRNPIGKRFQLGPWSGKRGYKIIGVVGDQKYLSLRESVPPTAYLYIAQLPQAALPSGVTFELRSAVPPMSLTPSIGHILQSVDFRLRPTDVKTLAEQVDASLSQDELLSKLSSFFALLALTLASIGLYGVVSYAVTRRTQEIGIRMALGAQKGDVLSMVVGQGLKLALIGIVLGIVGALSVTRFLSSLLYGVKPTDPLTFVAVSLILLGVALLACYIPARRAAKVDPMVALRHE